MVTAVTIFNFNLSNPPMTARPSELEFFVISSACATVPLWQSPRQLDPHLADPDWLTYTLRRLSLAGGMKEGKGER